MNNQKVFPKKLIDSGFVFKFENLKKIVTFWHLVILANILNYII
jgi:NAD dependent epimerase/dehydratase family enzyme